MEKSLRDKTEKYIHMVIKEMDSSGFNTGLYNELFKRMNNNEFGKFKARLASGETVLQLMESKGTNKTITQLTNIADKLGVKLYHKIKSKIPGTNRNYISPFERKVLMMITRKAKQDGERGQHIPTSSKKRDALTGQVTDGVRLTLPEMKIISGLNTPAVLEELLSQKGGDLGAKVAGDAMIEKYGVVSLKDLASHKTISGSTKMIANYFKGAHISFKTEPLKET